MTTDELGMALDSGPQRQEIVVAFGLALNGLDERRNGIGGDHVGGLQKGTAYPAVQFMGT
jgi:hypothetical protein